MKDPDAFLKRIGELNDDPDATDHCLIELKDGRSLERYSTGLRSETGQGCVRGSHLGRVWFFRDITERRKAEQELQFQLSLIRAIHEVSLDGIIVVDDENVILAHNKRYLDVWRLPLPDDSENLGDRAVDGQPPLVLSRVLDRVKDPQAYLRRIAELDNDPDSNAHFEIELTGRQDPGTLLHKAAGRDWQAPGTCEVLPGHNRAQAGRAGTAEQRGESFASWRKTFVKCFG